MVDGRAPHALIEGTIRQLRKDNLMRDVTSTDGRVPVGLFDFDSYWEIVEVVSAVLGMPHLDDLGSCKNNAFA